MSKRSYERRLKAKRERERAERKRAERMRTLRIWGSAVAAVAIGLILFLVFKGDGKTKTAAKPTPSGAQLTGCTAPAPVPTPNGKQYTTPPPMTIDTKKTFIATMETSCGTIKMTLNTTQAPATVNSFVFLAREGFFDGTTFGRVQNDPDFTVIQAGTQTGTISGGAGYSYDGEKPVAGTKYIRGIVAMANSGDPSSNGSQFFFVPKAAKFLDQNPNYTVLGAVKEPASLEVLDRILLAKGPQIQGGQLGVTPTPPIYILKVTIEEK